MCEEIFFFLFEFDDGIFCFQIHFTGEDFSISSYFELIGVKLQGGEVFIFYKEMEWRFFFESSIVVIEALGAFGDDARSSDDDK